MNTFLSYLLCNLILLKVHLYTSVSQARESASLRETLRSEREAHAAELQALRTAVLKQEKLNKERRDAEPKPPPAAAAAAEKEAQEERRRRAEEKAAQEILRLTQVGALAVLCVTLTHNFSFLKIAPFYCFKKIYHYIILYFFRISILLLSV